MELLHRAQITQATLDRYRGKPLVYGGTDCVQMFAFHVRAMGHRVLLTKGGRYSTMLGAVKALKRYGHASLTEAVDALGFDRIPPAAAITGDVLALPQEEGAPLEALTIALGNGRVLGFYDDLGATVLQPVMYETGWRVPCLRS